MVSELDEIRRRVRNIWGAISSNQVIDKDVEGQAKQLLKYVDDLHRASSQVAAANPAQVTDAKAIVDASLPPHEQAMLGHDAITVLTDAIAAAIGAGGQAVADTWFTDRALPVKAMSGDVEDNRVLRLHFRRPVTDDDRKSMCDALNLHQASLAHPQPLPLKDEVERVLERLRKIADAYDDNALDDEARKFWGRENQHENQTPPEHIELYQGRGGARLLTLQDCFEARALLSRLRAGEHEGWRSQTADAAWQELLEKDDRTSPTEYPDMALITHDELAAFMGVKP